MPNEVQSPSPLTSTSFDLVYSAEGGPAPSGVTPQDSFHTTDDYHVRTQLADGRMSVGLDIGSVGNLGGDRWAQAVAIQGAKHGKEPLLREANEAVECERSGAWRSGRPIRLLIADRT